MYSLHYVAKSHPGKIRENNEDNIFVDGYIKEDINEEIIEHEGWVEDGNLTAVVCDGMGGCTNGERASYLAVKTMKEYLERAAKKTVPAIREDAMLYVNEANASICDEMVANRCIMGSTMALLDFCEDTVVGVNIGDSRIYQLHSNELKMLSTDHTIMARLLRMKQITEEEAKTHPMKHRITQHLGIQEDEMVLSPAVTEKINVAEGDKYLICSDGLTDMLSDEEIKEILIKKMSLKETANLLLEGALEAGGKDNITILVIGVGGQNKKTLNEKFREFIHRIKSNG